MNPRFPFVAAAFLLAGCSTNVNVAPLSVAPENIQPRDPERVEVFDHKTQPTRPYMNYGLVTTDSTEPSAVLAELREKGGDKGCDAIVLRPERGQADCIIYKRED